MAPTTRSFLGGLLVGTVGLKLLGSRDAKKLYAHLIAGGMKVKDTLDHSVEGVRASYDDVMADRLRHLRAGPLRGKEPRVHRA